MWINGENRPNLTKWLFYIQGVNIPNGSVGGSGNAWDAASKDPMDLYCIKTHQASMLALMLGEWVWEWFWNAAWRSVCL